MDFFNNIYSNIEKKNEKIIQKTNITLIYEDKVQTVSWFSDTPISDARFAVICACDSLVDGEFQVLDDRANILEIEKITEFKNNQIFFIKKTSSNPTNILLDSRRKLYIEIPALKHIETQTALKNMLLGSNLLKHKQKSFPHLRLFQISIDLKRMFWYIKSKKINEAQIIFENIFEISFGENNGLKKNFPLNILHDFTFSLHYYKKESHFNSDFSKNHKKEILQLTCKDEREFDLWVIGIKALCAHNTGRLICKDELLSHSLCYLDQIKKGNLANCSSYLFYNRNNNTKSKDNMENKDNEKNIVYLDENNLNVYENKNLIDFKNHNLGNIEFLDSNKDLELPNNNKSLIFNQQNKVLNDNMNDLDKNQFNNNINKRKSLDQLIASRNLSKYQLAKIILKINYLNYKPIN